MNRRRQWMLMLLALVTWGIGCTQPSPRPDYIEATRFLHEASHLPPRGVGLPSDPTAIALGPLAEPAPPELTGPQPVDVYIRRAMEQNRGVQAAWFNVQAMKHRIPQATALDDPMVLNNIWPFPRNAPQYALMGYGPYDVMITQQFPWFGTLRLRGEVAEQDVKAALSELVAAQLEVVARVKRAYYNLYLNQQAEGILEANRALVEDFVEIAAIRYQTGATSQQDLLRAENVVIEVDTELAEVRQGLAESRAALARQLHISPETDLQALPELPPAVVPAQIETLYNLAAQARPELHGQLAAIARGTREVELARKKYYPDTTLGLNYMMMSREDAMSEMADGRDNFGLVVGFNLPIYRDKLAAGVREAEARTVAEARRYEDLRDETYESIKELFAEVEARREVLGMFREGYLPRSQQALEVATSDYQTGALDFITLITAWREVLQVELQIVRLEAELGRALAALERVVGVQIQQHPAEIAGPELATPEPVDDLPAPPPTTTEESPFRPIPEE